MKENHPVNEFHEIGDRIRVDIEHLDRDSSTFEVVALTGLLCATGILGRIETANTQLNLTVEKSVRFAMLKAKDAVIKPLPGPPEIRQ